MATEELPNPIPQSSKAENLPNPIPEFSKLYNLTLLEIGSDLYILDRVGVHYARTDLARIVNHPVYKVYSSGKTIKENIADFIENGGIPSDDELKRNIPDNSALVSERGSLDSGSFERGSFERGSLDSNASLESEGEHAEVVSANGDNPFADGKSVDVNNNGTITRGNIIKENDDGSFDIEYVNGTLGNNVSKANISPVTKGGSSFNDNLQSFSVDNKLSADDTRLPSSYHSGGINYTYKTGSYPKNVSFSKKNPYKKTNKKTLRKLQRIIHNA